MPPRKKQGCVRKPVFVGVFAGLIFRGPSLRQDKKAGRGFSRIPRGQASGLNCGTGGGPHGPNASEQSRKQGRYRSLAATDATRDRGGARGAKLSNGFHKTPLAGRPTASLPVRRSRPQNAPHAASLICFLGERGRQQAVGRLLKSWTRKCLRRRAAAQTSPLRHCSAAKAVGSLAMRCGERWRAVAVVIGAPRGRRC